LRADPLKERNLYVPCPWCKKINCHRPHEGKTCRCYICRGVPTQEQFKKAVRFACRALDPYARKQVREILGDWR
jgi:hypothetical protein